MIDAPHIVIEIDPCGIPRRVLVNDVPIPMVEAVQISTEIDTPVSVTLRVIAGKIEVRQAS